MIRRSILFLTLAGVALPLASLATVLMDFGPGRRRDTRSAEACAAAAARAEELPVGRFYRLSYLHGSRVGSPEEHMAVPEPDGLHIPRGYSARDDVLPVESGFGAVFSTV